MSTFLNISADEIKIGENVIIEPSAVIRGIDGKSRKIVIGDNSYIGHDVQIICDHFELGDYSKIHHHTNVHGYMPCVIGHNAWIGQYSIIDSIGGATIGDNCCIGAGTQLWSHIKYGDTLEGCQFLGKHSLEVGNDVWFAGHCTICPIKAENKSMALAGAVVTKDMRHNEIYAGIPAKSITKKLGFQFKSVTTEDKLKKMQDYLQEWNKGGSSIKIVSSKDEMKYPEEFTYFNVATRKYNKRLTEEEINFMKFLLPEKAKFTPL